jgi:hypothetical protein
MEIPRSDISPRSQETTRMRPLPSTRTQTPTTSFATKFPTPHEIYSTDLQQPNQYTPTVANTNHHSTTLAQTLRASFNHPKLPKNRTNHNKPIFRNPSELTEYLSNNKKYTDNDRYNFSFKLDLPCDSSATFAPLKSSGVCLA